MKFAIEHAPSFAWLRVQLEPSESIQAEAGAMVTRTPSLEMHTHLNAGRGAGFGRKLMAIFVALLRKVFGGETMFVNDFVGPEGGEVVLAPHLSGTIMHRRLEGNERLFVQAGSFLASTGSIDTKLRWGGLRSLFGGEGLFLLECSGQGDLFVNSYGSIVEVPVGGAYVVDTGHIVAFDGTLDFKIKGAGGLKQTLFSGEGLTVHFNGSGKLYLQSRNLNSLVGFVSPFLRS